MMNELIFKTSAVFFLFTAVFMVHQLALTFLVRRINSRRHTRAVYTLFSFFGTVLHELSHAIMCVVFRHKIKKVVLFTLKDTKARGYVNHQYNPRSMYQCLGGFMIAIAPWIASLITVQLAFPNLTSHLPLEPFRSGYFLELLPELDLSTVIPVSLIIFFCIPSKTDFVNATKSSVIVLLLIAAAFLVGDFFQMTTAYIKVIEQLLRLSYFTMTLYLSALLMIIGLTSLTFIGGRTE
jgi:hypothetical protein